MKLQTVRGVKLFKTLQLKKGRSVTNRPSPFTHFKPQHINNMKRFKRSNTLTKKSRVKKYKVKFFPDRNLDITFRRYKASAAQRSTKKRQMVLPLYLTSFKEVQIKYQKQIKKPTAARNNVASKWQFAQLPLILMLFGMGGAVFFAVQTTQKPQIRPASTFAIPTYSAPAPTLIKGAVAGLPRSEPTKVNIPTVGIESGIKPVGKNADGSMEVPPLFEHITGWYTPGPTPGEIGPAIIVGHVDTLKGPAVFYKLREMKPGDIVEINRKDGTLVKFKVVSLQQYSQSNFPTEAVYGNTTNASLRLITCGGVFNKSTGQYTENTVVFADKV